LTDFAINIFFLLVAFFILSASHDLNPLFSVPNVLLVLVVGAGALLAVVYAIWNTRVLGAIKNLKVIAWITQMAVAIPDQALADFGLWASVFLALAGIWMLDAATLWVLLLALGVHAPISTIFACSIISSVAANIILIPGGLGIFEGSSIALLSLFGIPLEQAIAASVLVRGFTYWLPMIPGFLITRREFVGSNKGERLSGET
jgi:uncharacterized protein (TIRG00374 family)